MSSRDTTTTENVFTVPAADLTEGEETLVPKDVPGDVTQYRPTQQDSGHRAWLVKLVASEDSDADVEVEAAITTGDDTEFEAYIKEGTADTATGGETAPDSVAAVFSDEATMAGINAALTPATEPTAGEYTVVIESRRY